MRILFILIIVGLITGFKSQNTKMKEEITILQTADIHAYLNPHNELFVENNAIVFRKAGGLSHIKTLVDEIRKENQNGTLFIDGGDLIQGSGESVLSEGKIFPPIIQQMNYDLLIPGNWEVIYGKKIMLDVMKKYKTNVIHRKTCVEHISSESLSPGRLYTLVQIDVITQFQTVVSTFK